MVCIDFPSCSTVAVASLIAVATCSVAGREFFCNSLSAGQSAGARLVFGDLLCSADGSHQRLRLQRYVVPVPDLPVLCGAIRFIPAAGVAVP